MDDGHPCPNEYGSLLNRLDKLFEQRPSGAEISAYTIKNVAQYKLERVLGSGGFGIVYLAEDTRLNRLVALKLPRIEVLFDQEKRERFKSEAITTGRLNHPSIVKVYEANLDGPVPFIASEYCDGPNLSEWLQTTNGLQSWQQSAALVASLADAVEHAHRHQVFHRDLKPANVMLTLKEEHGQQRKEYAQWQLDQCNARLTDFGLAKLIDSSLVVSRTSQVWGTPLYMAPEQIEKKLVGASAATDVYSLGVILFELLTGMLPINGSSYIRVLDKIRTVSPSRLSSFRKNLPRDLESICAKCLEKNPHARYASAKEFAEDLRHCINGRPVVGKRVKLHSRIAYWCTRPRRIQNAGWYVISWISITALWITFNVLVLPLHTPTSAADFQEGVRDLILLSALAITPSIWLGWKIVEGKSWALWAMLIYSIVRIPLLVKAMFVEPVYFTMIYRANPTFSFVDHSMMVIACCVQLFLITCGILAKRRLQSTNRPDVLEVSEKLLTERKIVSEK